MRLAIRVLICCPDILATKTIDKTYTDHPITWHNQYNGNLFFMVLTKVKFFCPLWVPHLIKGK